MLEKWSASEKVSARRLAAADLSREGGEKNRAQHWRCPSHGGWRRQIWAQARRTTPSHPQPSLSPPSGQREEKPVAVDCEARVRGFWVHEGWAFFGEDRQGGRAVRVAKVCCCGEGLLGRHRRRREEEEERERESFCGKREERERGERERSREGERKKEKKSFFNFFIIFIYLKLLK